MDGIVVELMISIWIGVGHLRLKLILGDHAMIQLDCQ